MSHTALPDGGLYAITKQSTSQNDEQLLEAVEQAILGGGRVIQYRDKSQDQTRRRQTAQALLQICRKHQVPLIINDDVQLARIIQADGVHLGHEDGNARQARTMLGPEAIIGVSCYNRLALARLAASDGASYIAFGRFFNSQSKPNAVQAEVSLLRQAQRELTVPVVAIGGITPENGGQLLQAGADFLAVIQGVFSAPNIRQAAGQYQALFGANQQSPIEPIP